MNLFFNIIVLLFEVLYYTTFIKLCNNEGKISKYLLLFSLITILFSFVGTTQIYSYLILIILMLYGLKYIVKIKVGLYDMFLLFIMMFFKIIIEYIIVLIFYNILKLPISINIIMFSIIKILILLLIKNKMYLFNLYLKERWKNNNFYIRYLFTIFLFIYVIISCITIIFY